MLYFLPSSVGQSSIVKLGVLGAGLFANSTLLPVIKNNKDFELGRHRLLWWIACAALGQKIWLSIRHFFRR
jgi:hypothetical protein